MATTASRKRVTTPPAQNPFINFERDLIATLKENPRYVEKLTELRGNVNDLACASESSSVVKEELSYSQDTSSASAWDKLRQARSTYRDCAMRFESARLAITNLPQQIATLAAMVADTWDGCRDKTATRASVNLARQAAIASLEECVGSFSYNVTDIVYAQARRRGWPGLTDCVRRNSPIPPIAPPVIRVSDRHH